MSIRPSRAVLTAALIAVGVSTAACHRSRNDHPQGQLTTTQAQSGDNTAAPVLVPGLTCNADGFLTETANPGVAKVTANEVHFVTDHGDGCPSDGPACQAKAYVMKGDTVMTGVANGPYVCAYLPTKGGGSAGWVKPAEITEATVNAAPPLEAWSGAWRLGDAVINVSIRDNNLVADGTAPVPGAALAAAAAKPATPPTADVTAPTGAPPAAAAPPPAGKMSGVAQPVGDSVEFAAADPNGCRVDLRLIGPFLAAKDNGQCGGGARFAGVFRRPSVASVGGPAKGGTSKSNPNKNVFY